jgi:hypothetical protein
MTLHQFTIFSAIAKHRNLTNAPRELGVSQPSVSYLGTLIVAQATNSTKGSKGADEFQPSPSDLVLHGGVLALERVQQVLWTLTVVGMFIVIVYKQYPLATELPTTPTPPDTHGYKLGRLSRRQDRKENRPDH